jgi:helicase MOV-10
MYAGYYQRLLWTEELQLLADLAVFDLVEENATELAPRQNGLLAVHVHGLAEKRLSVLKGDILKM